MRNTLFKLLILLSIPLRLKAQQDTSKWYNQLPKCPCKNPDMNGVRLKDGWARDKGNLAKYHNGATASYRSYPPVKTRVGQSGQQCCYDASGLLISSGRAAGTPDKVSTCSGENQRGEMKLRLWGLWGHYRKDVRPWLKLMKQDSSGWRIYNAYWLPDSGNCGSQLK